MPPPRKREDILAPCTLPAKQSQITPAHLLWEKVIDVRRGQDFYGSSPGDLQDADPVSRNRWTFFRMEPASERWFRSIRSKATLRDLFYPMTSFSKRNTFVNFQTQMRYGNAPTSLWTRIIILTLTASGTGFPRWRWKTSSCATKCGPI